MVSGTYNYSYWGESKPTYNWGASHCRIEFDSVCGPMKRDYLCGCNLPFFLLGSCSLPFLLGNNLQDIGLGASVPRWSWMAELCPNGALVWYPWCTLAPGSQMPQRCAGTGTICRSIFAPLLCDIRRYDAWNSTSPVVTAASSMRPRCSQKIAARSSEFEFQPASFRWDPNEKLRKSSSNSYCWS